MSDLGADVRKWYINTAHRLNSHEISLQHLQRKQDHLHLLERQLRRDVARFDRTSKECLGLLQTVFSTIVAAEEEEEERCDAPTKR